MSARVVSWGGLVSGDAVGLAVQDEFPGGGLEPVGGGLGEQGLGVRASHSAGSRLDVVMVPAASIGWRQKSSRISRSVRRSLRICSSWLLSRRAALIRLRSWSARSNQTVCRVRMAAWPRAVARNVLPVPTCP